MSIVAIIQARMGSSRLPGKMMLPLEDSHVLEHDIHRVRAADKIDQVVVATSDQTADDIIARYARQAGAIVYRGSEEDVLGRIFEAATQEVADCVVRITGDCPLVSPEVIDTVVRRQTETGADYCSNILDRSFPRGLDVEVLTMESFETVADVASDPFHREHVTGYYHENPDRFDLTNVTSDEVFEESWMRDRDDLRLTLDEADDYEVLREIYENVPFDDILDVRDAVRYVDEHNLMAINKNVEQKSK